MSNRIRIIRFLCLTALLFVALACLTRPSSPAGRYVADGRIGLVGDFCWEFSTGKVALVHEGGRVSSGTYSRTTEGWFWTDDSEICAVPTVFRVQYSGWQLRFYDQSGRKVGTMRRRIIPGLRPHWVPDWIQ